MHQAAPSTAPTRVARGLAASEELILEAFARYFYLTAEQLRRLLYGQGSLRYAQDRLKSLMEAGYLLGVERPPSRHGKVSRIYTLHRCRASTQSPRQGVPHLHASHARSE